MACKMFSYPVHQNFNNLAENYERERSDDALYIELLEKIKEVEDNL